jgi:DNA-directed RNA polymerase I, II, and III subunit RPABC4
MRLLMAFSREGQTSSKFLFLRIAAIIRRGFVRQNFFFQFFSFLFGINSQMDAQVENPAAAPQPEALPQPIQQVEGVKYICGDCGAENEIRSKDAIRCKSCGYRIMYKKRTWRTVQYEAR